MDMDASLKSRGIYVKGEWLTAVSKFLQTEGKLVTVEAVYEQFLYADMRQCGVGCLDGNIANSHKETIKGPYVLQVNQIFNIGTGHKNREEESSSRILKLALTDGVQLVFGFEYRRLPTSIHIKSKPGLKVLVRNIHIRRGLLMLQPQHVEILGGSVYQLCEQQESERQSMKGKRVSASLLEEKKDEPPKKKSAYPIVSGSRPTPRISAPIDHSSSTEAEKPEPGNVISNYFHKSPAGTLPLKKKSEPVCFDLSRRASESSTEVVDLVEDSKESKDSKDFFADTSFSDELLDAISW